MSSDSQQSLLVKVTGTDHPGVTASLTELISNAGNVIEDIEQIVIQGELILCLVISKISGDNAQKGFEQSLEQFSKENRVQVSCRPLESLGSNHGQRIRHTVTFIGEDLDAAGFHRVAQILAEHQANISRMRTLSSNPVRALEMQVGLPATAAPKVLRRALVKGLDAFDLDVAVQREIFMRRSKRLVVFDMDSTLVQMETIDELARLHGVLDEVSKITAEAMAGELDFEQSLRKRVSLLKGLSFEKALTLNDHLPITEGASKLICVLRTLGYKTAVISGGFTFAANALKDQLGLDEAFANQLEVVNGVLTGRVTGEVVSAKKKAELLQMIAQKENIHLEQTIAIGDGANDLPMLEIAGLGIAFHAKPKVQEEADTSLRGGGLERILYLLGMNEGQVQELLEYPDCNSRVRVHGS